jgi:cytochrome c
MHENPSLTLSRCGVAAQLGGEMGKFFSAAADALCLSLALSCFGAGVHADEDGARLFRNTCGICHTLEPGKNRIGPSLAGIIGRKAGTVAGFDYSEANKDSNVVWDEAQLDEYLSNPQQFMSGTKMIYPGMKDAEQRKALIAYLRDPK